MTKQEALLTKSGAGRIADVTPAAIAAAARQGRIAVALTTASGIRLFRPADVRTYAANRRRRRGDRTTTQRADAG